MTDLAAHSRAASAYRNSSRVDADPRSVAVALHEGLAHRLRAAKYAYEQKALDQMCRVTAECLQILVAARAVMDFRKAGPQGAMLERFYKSLARDIRNLLRSADPVADIEKMVAKLTPPPVSVTYSYKADTVQKLQ